MSIHSEWNYISDILEMASNILPDVLALYVTKNFMVNKAFPMEIINDDLHLMQSRSW